MKKLLIAAAISLLAIPTYASDLATVASSTYQLYLNNVVVCSGTFVRSDEEADWFLTANHCVKKAATSSTGSLKVPNQYTVKNVVLDEDLNPISEEIFYLDILQTNTAKDVALLSVKSPVDAVFTTVDVATVDEVKANLVIGSELIASGYPLGDFYSLTNGYYVGPSKVTIPEIQDEVYYKTSISIDGGSSGGGLYEEIDGTWKLIGAATARDGRLDFRSMFSTIESVQLLLGPKFDTEDALYNK